MTRITREDGFTLVEIAVTLAVVAIALVMGWPSLQGWKERIDLRNAASGVSELLLTARMRAVVERRTYTVSVDYANDLLSAAPAVAALRKWGGVDLHADTADPDCLPLSGQSIAFRPNGTADAAGFEAVYVKSRNPRIPLRYRVKVLGATGKVSVERSAGGTWTGAY